VISYHQTQIWYDSKVVLSCQYNRFKHLNFNYIYLISYKIAKKGKPSKKDLPLLENDITTFELALKYGIHISSKHKFQIDDFDPKRNHFRVV
jgi:hypothetical protein